MKIKNLTILIAFSLALTSCSQLNGSNVNTKETNLVVDDYEKDKKIKENVLSTEDEDISSILNKDKENLQKENPKKEIDVDKWKKKLVNIGQFDQDFVDGLAKDRIKDLVKEAQDLAEKTGYWDIKDFVFQKLAKDFPEKSKKFPLDSIDKIYDWKISDNDEATDKYQTERGYLIENGLDENTAYSIANKDLKQSFKKAYKEDEDAYYNDYIKAVVKMYKNEDAPKEDTPKENNQNGEENVEPMYQNQADYDQLKDDMVNHYGFDPEVVKNISNNDIDLASARAQKKLEETGFGDIGLVFDELGKMYPGASSMYPGN